MPPKQKKEKKNKVVPVQPVSPGFTSHFISVERSFKEAKKIKGKRAEYPSPTNAPNPSPASPSSPQMFNRPRLNAETPTSPFVRATTKAVEKQYKSIHPEEKQISPEFKKQQMLQSMWEKTLPLPAKLPVMGTYTGQFDTKDKKPMPYEAKTPKGGLYGSHRMERPSIDLPPLLLPPAAAADVASSSMAPPQPSVVKREKSKKSVSFKEPKEEPKEFKKGGKIKKTGVVKVHKGEFVIPANKVASVDKALKKAGLKPLKK